MKEKVKEMLFNLKHIKINDSTKLIEDGILTSLDIAIFISNLQDEFDVEIGLNELDPENFNTINSICKMIKNKQSEK